MFPPAMLTRSPQRRDSAQDRNGNTQRSEGDEYCCKDRADDWLMVKMLAGISTHDPGVLVENICGMKSPVVTAFFAKTTHHGLCAFGKVMDQRDTVQDCRSDSLRIDAGQLLQSPGRRR